MHKEAVIFMGIEYLGLSSINGPLVILEGVQDAFFLMRSSNLG